MKLELDKKWAWYSTPILRRLRTFDVDDMEWAVRLNSYILEEYRREKKRASWIQMKNVWRLFKPFWTWLMHQVLGNLPLPLEFFRGLQWRDTLLNNREWPRPWGICCAVFPPEITRRGPLKFFLFQGWLIDGFSFEKNMAIAMLECGWNLSNPCKSLSNYDVTVVV